MILLLLLLWAFPAHAQRVFRAEFIPYDTREAAVAADRSKATRFSPLTFRVADGTASAQLSVPGPWSDCLVYLHMENVGAPYALRVNGRTVALIKDENAIADFDLTAFVAAGDNRLELLPLPGAAGILIRKPFENCYVFAQEKRSIKDFSVSLGPDSLHRFGVLDLSVIVQNGFNYEEPVTVGYDIYDPTGKLLEYSVNEIRVAGRSTDTLRWTPYIYHTNEHRWRGGQLYKIMLYTKRDGAFKEYIPLQTGFLDGKPVALKIKRFDALATKAETKKQLTALLKTHNAVQPSSPQPRWFYDACDEVGMRVIDAAGIHFPEHRDDRRVHGTPSNDPAWETEYVERVRAMWARARNHTCIVGFATGSQSGNGYAMYKAYEALKALESKRPVIYDDAADEWNNDAL